jgi:hypothetical protein
MTKRKPATQSERPTQPLALSIRQFCDSHDISIDTYFRMARVGNGPQTMRVGGRTLISIEAAAAWRRERELAAQEAPHRRNTEAPEENAAA